MNKLNVVIIEDEVPAARLLNSMVTRLRPEWNYHIFLNSPPFLGFRSAQGGTLPAVPWSFSTGKLPEAAP